MKNGFLLCLMAVLCCDCAYALSQAQASKLLASAPSTQKKYSACMQLVSLGASTMTVPKAREQVFEQHPVCRGIEEKLKAERQAGLVADGPKTCAAGQAEVVALWTKRNEERQRSHRQPLDLTNKSFVLGQVNYLYPGLCKI